MEKPSISEGDVIPEDDWLGTEAAGVSGASGLNPSDDALLLFFRRFARPREQQVIDAMRSRKLFKRLYVLTYTKERDAYSKERAAYDQIYDRFHTYRLEGNLREIERLRKACEDRVRTQVLENLQNERGDRLGAEVAEIKNRIETADPLILLDVPVKAVSRGIEKESIYYLPEDIGGLRSGPGGVQQFFTTPVALEKEPFDKAVGKIRLFAPPDLKDILVRCLPEHHDKLTEFLIG